MKNFILIMKYKIALVFKHFKYDRRSHFDDTVKKNCEPRKNNTKH